MVSVMMIIALVAAIISLLQIRKSSSAYFVSIAGIFSIYPLLINQHPLLIVAVMMLFASFEYLSAILIKWDKRRFNSIRQSRFKLFMVIISLLTGFSAAWWSQQLTPKGLDKEVVSHWWKFFVVLALATHLYSLQKRYKSREGE